MAAVGEARFKYTATGVLGDKRDTMLENQLLLRNELGKSTRRGYRGYPGDEERYGRPNVDGSGGAALALSWAGGKSTSAMAGLHFPSKNGGGDAEAQGLTGRDFMALNKSAVQSGLVTAAEQYQYRGTHDIRRKPAPPAGGGGDAGATRSSTRRIPPSMVFGISTRPSTPIHDLLEHRYQDKWLAERRSADMAHKSHSALASASAEETRGQLSKVNQTRASMLRVYQVPVDNGKLWKLPRFSKNAKPSLSTFRTPGLQSASYDHHKLDGINRQGNVGLGVYESAKC